MTPEIWIALAGTNLAISLVPGQSVAFASAATARHGLRAGAAAVAGLIAAEAVWSMTALTLALGARELHPALWLALQLAGGCLLVAFGIKGLRRARPGAKPCPCPPPRRIAIQAMGVGFANPLNLVFFLSLFPSFVSAGDTGSAAGMALFYGSAIVLSSPLGLAPYVAASSALARRGLGRALEVVSASALLAIGLTALGRLATA